jgi:hypothetical protein
MAILGSRTGPRGSRLRNPPLSAGKCTTEAESGDRGPEWRFWDPDLAPEAPGSEIHRCQKENVLQRPSLRTGVQTRISGGSAQVARWSPPARLKLTTVLHFGEGARQEVSTVLRFRESCYASDQPLTTKCACRLQETHENSAIDHARSREGVAATDLQRPE